jgi:hypothetical protein
MNRGTDCVSRPPKTPAARQEVVPSGKTSNLWLQMRPNMCIVFRTPDLAIFLISSNFLAPATYTTFEKACLIMIQPQRQTKMSSVLTFFLKSSKANGSTFQNTSWTVKSNFAANLERERAIEHKLLFILENKWRHVPDKDKDKDKTQITNLKIRRIRRGSSRKTLIHHICRGS